MRSWILMTLLAAMLVLVAACGDDDDDDGDSAEADTVTDVSDDQSPTVEPEPTPTSTAAPEPTPEPEPTSTPTEVPQDEPDDQTDEEASEQDDETEQQETSDAAQSGDLDALLLSLDELPADWTEAAMDMEAEEEVGDIAEDPFQAPCGIEPIEDVYDPVAEGQRNFQGTELGPFVSQNLVQLASPDDASQSLNHIRELFGCEEWVETDEFGEEMTFEITETEVEGIGDDALGLRLGLSFGDEPEMDMFGDFGIDMIFFQRNEFVSVLMYIDIFGMSEVDFQGLAQSADERIQAGQ